MAAPGKKSTDWSTLKYLFMKKNMGKADKMLRMIVAMVIGMLYLNHNISGLLATLLIVLAGVFLMSSLFNFCPLYVPFGIDTRENK